MTSTPPLSSQQQADISSTDSSSDFHDDPLQKSLLHSSSSDNAAADVNGDFPSIDGSSSSELDYPPSLPISRMIRLDIYKNRGEFTFRALILGILIGVLVASVNVNLALRTGWTQGGGIFAAVVAIGVMKVVNPDVPFTKQETAIALTAASAAGTMTSTVGLASAIPALKMLGVDYSMVQLTLWGLAVAFFGVYFAVPLRKQMIVMEKLEFPSGKAAAVTIHALFARSSETVKKAQMLLSVAFASGGWSLAAFFVPWLEDPPFPREIGRWGFTPHVNLLLAGGGMLSGLRACTSLLLGTIVGWGILSPIAYHYQWTEEQSIMGFKGSRGWILWVGVSIMASEALVSLLFSFPIMVKGCIAVGRRAFKASNTSSRDNVSYSRINSEDDNAAESNALDQEVDNNQSDNNHPESNTFKHSATREEKRHTAAHHYIPWYWWTTGIILSTMVLTLIGHVGFHIKFYFIWTAIPLSFLLSIVAIRCTGTTDINPVGGVGKVTQLIYAGLAPGQIQTNLLSAGIIAAGASQAGDMMQDLKTGYLHNVSPRSQFFTQLIGICAGLVVSVPIYKLYDAAYHIGYDIPAPAAHAWKAVAEVLSKGLSHLPQYSGWGALGGFIFGATIAALYQLVRWIPGKGGKKISEFIPSALAFGIGMVVPPKQGLTMFAGALLALIWQVVTPQHKKKYFFAVSSGLICGEGLIGIAIALLRLVGVKPLVAAWDYGETE